MHKVPQRSITGLLCDCSSMFESELHSLMTQVMAALGDFSSDPTLKRRISEIFQCCNTGDLFHASTTDQIFFKEEFHYGITRTLLTCTWTCYWSCMKYCSALQEPGNLAEELLLEPEHNAQPLQKAVWDFVYDIPLLESLQQLLSDSFILGDVHEYVAAMLQSYTLCAFDTGTSWAPTSRWIDVWLLWWHFL